MKRYRPSLFGRATTASRRCRHGSGSSSSLWLRRPTAWSHWFVKGNRPSRAFLPQESDELRDRGLATVGLAVDTVETRVVLLDGVMRWFAFEDNGENVLAFHRLAVLVDSVSHQKGSVFRAHQRICRLSRDATVLPLRRRSTSTSAACSLGWRRALLRASTATRTTSTAASDWFVQGDRPARVRSRRHVSEQSVCVFQL
jgi:hypothetical protein